MKSELNCLPDLIWLTKESDDSSQVNNNFPAEMETG